MAERAKTKMDLAAEIEYQRRRQEEEDERKRKAMVRLAGLRARVKMAEARQKGRPWIQPD